MCVSLCVCTRGQALWMSEESARARVIGGCELPDMALWTELVTVSTRTKWALGPWTISLAVDLALVFRSRDEPGLSFHFVFLFGSRDWSQDSYKLDNIFSSLVCYPQLWIFLVWNLNDYFFFKSINVTYTYTSKALQKSFCSFKCVSTQMPSYLLAYLRVCGWKSTIPAHGHHQKVPIPQVQKPCPWKCSN